MNRPAMSCLLPAAESHLHRRQGEVPARVAMQRLRRHRPGAVFADLLTSAALPLRGEMHYRRPRGAVTRPVGSAILAAARLRHTWRTNSAGLAQPCLRGEPNA
jgi:hypothetical protein